MKLGDIVSHKKYGKGVVYYFGSPQSSYVAVGFYCTNKKPWPGPEKDYPHLKRGVKYNFQAVEIKELVLCNRVYCI